MSNNKIAAVAIIIIFLVVSVVVYQNLANNQNTEPTNSTPTPTIEPTAVPTENPTVTPTTAPTPIPTVTPIIRIGELKVIDEFRAEIIITDNIHTFDEVEHKVWCACAFKVHYNFTYISNDNYKISINMIDTNHINPQQAIKYVYDDLFVKFDLTS